MRFPGELSKDVTRSNMPFASLAFNFTDIVNVTQHCSAEAVMGRRAANVFRFTERSLTVKRHGVHCSGLCHCLRCSSAAVRWLVVCEQASRSAFRSLLFK
jgi:hypothetical protein